MADRLAAVRARAIADEHGLDYVELARRALDPDAVRLLPLEVLERLTALPYEVDGDGVVRVAVANPSAVGADELERLSGRSVALAVAPAAEVAALLRDLAHGGTLRDDELRLEGELLEDAPAVRAVND